MSNLQKIAELESPKEFSKFKEGKPLEFYGFIYENLRAKQLYEGQMNEHDLRMQRLIEKFGAEKVEEMVYRINNQERKDFFEDNY